MKHIFNKISLKLLLLVGLCSAVANADSITLRDGRHVQGKFAGGTQGVIAFSVAGATQYFDVSNVIVMTFDAESSDAQQQGTTHQQQIPSIVPESGVIQRQQFQPQTEKAKGQVNQVKKSQKHPARLVLAAQRSE